MKDIFDKVRQFLNGDLVSSPNVKYFPYSIWMFYKVQNRHDCIFYMSKSACLLPVPIYRDRFSTQGLLHKTGNDHTIATRLAWTHGIEKADYDYRKFLFLVIGKS